MRNPLKIRCRCKWCSNVGRPEYIWFWNGNWVKKKMKEEMDEIARWPLWDRSIECKGFDDIHRGRDVRLMQLDPKNRLIRFLQSQIIKEMAKIGDIEGLKSIADKMMN